MRYLYKKTYSFCVFEFRHFSYAVVYFSYSCVPFAKRVVCAKFNSNTLVPGPFSLRLSTIYNDTEPVQ